MKLACTIPSHNWRDMPIWALLMLNDYAKNWKPYFLSFNGAHTSDAMECFHVRLVSDGDTYEIWEVVNYYGIKNLH